MNEKQHPLVVCLSYILNFVENCSNCVLPILRRCLNAPQHQGCNVRTKRSSLEKLEIWKTSYRVIVIDRLQTLAEIAQKSESSSLLFSMIAGRLLQQSEEEHAFRERLDRTSTLTPARLSFDPEERVPRSKWSSPAFGESSGSGFTRRLSGSVFTRRATDWPPVSLCLAPDRPIHRAIGLTIGPTARPLITDRVTYEFFRGNRSPRFRDVPAKVARRVRFFRGPGLVRSLTRPRQDSNRFSSLGRTGRSPKIVKIRRASF